MVMVFPARLRKAGEGRQHRRLRRRPAEGASGPPRHLGLRPLGFASLVTPVQAPDCETDVAGLRLDFIYGRAPGFKGLDLGVVNHTTGDFFGVALGGANLVNDEFCGLQLGLLNWNDNGNRDWAETSYGGQVGLVNYADMFCGYQGGLVNISENLFTGVQSSLLNVARDMSGLQDGFYLIFGVNIASGNVRGCQIGLVNFAGTMESGVQIGIVNIIANNGWMPVFPIVNGSF